MHALTVSFGQTCSCLPGDLAFLDPERGLLCLRHHRPLFMAHVSDKPRSVFLRMARTLVQRSLGDPRLDDVVIGTSVDLSWWHRWIERLPLGADVEVHGRFLWYRVGDTVGSMPLPMPPSSPKSSDQSRA